MNQKSSTLKKRVDNSEGHNHLKKHIRSMSNRTGGPALCHPLVHQESSGFLIRSVQHHIDMKCFTKTETQR
ncbi:hypothetical protein Q8A67_024686 [Cirrhinus molitorella]|uniref:Uncharacterized protein n=1 Tax=Cirrhinus molitorella TaxID=172907 RepID=A0AA88P524_9TELE|nr:hypothetical protein Q8A67_024686 [Cirrhinus molitorella]